MSAGITQTYLGQAFDHIGMIIQGRSTDHTLMRRCVRSANISPDVTLFPGLVVHPVGSSIHDPGMPNQHPYSIVEMGSPPGRGLPYFLINGAPDFDVALATSPEGTPPHGDAKHPFVALSVKPGPPATATYLAIVVSQGFEFETTEFDTDQTYLAGQPLRPVQSNTDANAGKVTNQGGTMSQFSSGALVVGTHTVVGYVATAPYPNAYNRTVLSLHTYFVPGSS